MTILFVSGFEDPVSPFGWSGVSLTGAGYTAESSTNFPHHGSRNLYCTKLAGATDGTFACVYKTRIGNYHDHLFARAMNIMIDQLPPSGLQVRPIGFWQNRSANLICAYGFHNYTGTLRFAIHYRHAAAFVDALGPVAQLNTPYSLEAEILQSTEGNADGAARLWVNGVLAVEVAGLDNDDRPINNVLFGQGHGTGNATYDLHMWGDCFVLADEPIGVESEVLPKLTVRSDPELNVPVYVDNIFMGNTPIVIEFQTPGTYTIRVDSEVTR